jgi:hypothetical protein
MSFRFDENISWLEIKCLVERWQILDWIATSFDFFSFRHLNVAKKCIFFFIGQMQGLEALNDGGITLLHSKNWRVESNTLKLLENDNTLNNLIRHFKVLDSTL